MGAHAFLESVHVEGFVRFSGPATTTSHVRVWVAEIVVVAPTAAHSSSHHSAVRVSVAGIPFHVVVVGFGVVVEVLMAAASFSSTAVMATHDGIVVEAL